MARILITGASSGLGYALARRMSSPDNALLLLARRVGRLDALAQEIRNSGGTVSLYPADVTDQDQMREIARDILSREGVPDLIVANAGIRGTGNGNGPETTEDIFRTNLMGVIYTVDPFMSAMKEARRGQIALVGSLAAYRGLPGAGGYCASKAALSAWSDSLRFEMEPCGITVSLVNPGFVTTEMTRNNPYPMPFLWTADRAAEAIIRGLDRRKARIEFPLPMVLLLRAFALLPPRAGDRIFRFFMKPGLPEG